MEGAGSAGLGGPLVAHLGRRTKEGGWCGSLVPHRPASKAGSPFSPINIGAPPWPLITPISLSLLLLDHVIPPLELRQGEVLSTIRTPPCCWSSGPNLPLLRPWIGARRSSASPYVCEALRGATLAVLGGLLPLHGIEVFVGFIDNACAGA